MSTLLSLTVRVLGIIAHALVSGSLSAFMFRGWWILGIVAVAIVIVSGAWRVRKRSQRN